MEGTVPRTPSRSASPTPNTVCVPVLTRASRWPYDR